MLKKIFAIFLILITLFASNMSFVVMAQEEIILPSPIPEPTPEVVVLENNAEVTNEIVSDTNSGENTITTVEPSIVPAELEPTPTLLRETPNPSSTPESTPSATPTSEIATSNSESTVEVQNNVNSNILNSDVVYHTLNIYLPENGNIDLSLLMENVLTKVYEKDNNLSETVSLIVTTTDNFAYVESIVASEANSGENTVSGETGNSSIVTGDSYSTVSVLNNVNTNIIDSKLHLVNINIYGVLEGNIILPEFSSNNQSCNDCGTVTNTSNTAVINNNINSSANTGQNSVMSTDSTSSSDVNITTGEAKSSVNIVNIVNTNLINLIFRYFYINNLGIWIGEFLGFNDNAAKPETIQSEGGCVNCSVSAAGGANVAVLNNNITSMVNTGRNNITSTEGISTITSGNAYSNVSLVNIVNSNIINSSGFIGFINIFGSLIGDIGGTSMFVEDIKTEETIPVVINDQQEPNNNSSQKESGGILEVSHTNNVGTHVLPGDTVTFFVKIKNIGYGKVYDTKLKIELFKDGKSYGGTYFDLGDINSQKALKFTTGLVMSKKAITGVYKAVVTSVGTVGPDNHSVESTSESEFKILGFNTFLTSGTKIESTVQAKEETIPQVLGASNNSSFLDPLAKKMIVVFSVFLLFYLCGKGYQKRKIIFNYAHRIGSLLT